MAQIDNAYAENETARAAALAGQIARVLERLRQVDPAERPQRRLARRLRHQPLRLPDILHGPPSPSFWERGLEG